MHVGAEDASREQRALTVALALVAAFLGAEVVGGVLADSLALLADAGYMLGDAGSLALALFAVWMGRRPATPARTFGFRRLEILAALANGVALVAIALWIFVEAARRIADPPETVASWVLALGLAGVAVNLATAFVLRRSRSRSLNLEAAFRHVVADLLGSLGVVVAGVVILATGWLLADPLVSLVIGLLILLSSWGVLRESVAVLLEGTPAGIDATDVGHAMAALDGVQEVHDLHIWTITSGFPSLSAHVLVAPRADCHGIRLELERLLAERFGLTHTTLQVEHARSRRVELTRLERGGPE